MSSSSKTDAATGMIPKDLVLSNLEFKNQITQCSGNIKSKVVDTCLLNSVTAIVDNLTVNNNLTLPPSSFIRLRMNPTGDPAGDFSFLQSDDLDSAFNFANATVVPGNLSTVVGTDLTPGVNSIIVQTEGIYNVHYDIIQRTYNVDRFTNTLIVQSLGSDGTPRYDYDAGTNSYIQRVYSVLVSAIVINGNTNVTDIYGHDELRSQLLPIPLLSGDAIVHLQPGDTIQLYIYAMTTVPHDPSNPAFLLTLGYADLIATKI